MRPSPLETRVAADAETWARLVEKHRPQPERPITAAKGERHTNFVDDE